MIECLLMSDVDYYCQKSDVDYYCPKNEADYYCQKNGEENQTNEQ